MSWCLQSFRMCLQRLRAKEKKSKLLILNVQHGAKNSLDLKVAAFSCLLACLSDVSVFSPAWFIVSNEVRAPPDTAKAPQIADLHFTSRPLTQIEYFPFKMYLCFDQSEPKDVPNFRQHFEKKTINLIENLSSRLEGRIHAPAPTGDAADVTEAVNSRPVATAHRIIDDAAVGGGEKKKEKKAGNFEGGQLITLSLTAIHCRGGIRRRRSRRIKKKKKNSPRSEEHARKIPPGPSWWLGSRWPRPRPTTLLINQLSKQAHLSRLSALT